MRASCVVGAASASAASAIRAANDVRLALEDCLNALSADPSFDRARLRAGTCLMKLGAFREAARTFDACAPREDRQCVSASDAISTASSAGFAAGSSSDIARARARGRVRS